MLTPTSGTRWSGAAFFEDTWCGMRRPCWYKPGNRLPAMRRIRWSRGCHDYYRAHEICAAVKRSTVKPSTVKRCR